MILGRLWGLVIYLMLFTEAFKKLEITGSSIAVLSLAALATHGLLWWQVLRGGWALYRGADASEAWLVVGAVLWLLTLLGFQLLCLLCWYGISTPSADSKPWLQF